MLQGTIPAGSVGSLREFGSVGWLRSPAFDLAFVLGLAVLALGTGAVLSIHPALFPAVFFANLWVFGFQHVVATFTRTAFDRPSFLQYRTLNVVVPPLLFVIVVALGFGVGQWMLATIYFYWQTFHYARQSYGVAQMFARQPENAPHVNQQLSRWVLYIVPLWGILSRSAEDPDRFLGLPLRCIPVPAIAVSIAGVLCFALVGAWAVSQFRLVREQQLPLPHTLYMCSHILVFAAGYVLIEQIDIGWLVINVWHNTQYLFFVWHFNNKRFGERIDPERRFISWLSQRRHIVGYVATCLLLSTVIYTVAFQVSNHVALKTMSLAFIIGQTLNYHHYLVDGIIWKRRAQAQPVAVPVPSCSTALDRWGTVRTAGPAETHSAVGSGSAASLDRTVSVALGLLALAGCYAYSFPATYGDAAIYFNYFKTFFDLPFSYQAHQVSYGATSALHVVVFAIVFKLCGGYWLEAAKLINFLFIVAGAGLLYHTSKLRPAYFPLFCLAICSCDALLVSVAELFETGLVFFCVSVWLFWLRAGQTRRAILLAGALPLVRPELGLLAVVLFADLVVRRRETRWLPVFVLSALPVACYAAYMGASGAGALPASILSRTLRSVEQRTTWAQRGWQTFDELYAVHPMYVYGIAAFPLSLLVRRTSIRWELVAGVPLLALYSLFPPGTYLARYLTPVVPAVILSSVLAVADLIDRSEVATRLRRWGRAGVWIGILVSALLVAGIIHDYSTRQATLQRYDLGTWFLRDLAEELNPRVGVDDKILLYEIQSQYVLRGRAISVDGTVGNEVQPFLLGQETMTGFIRRAGIRFVVTSNSFAYRKIYDHTILADLYAADLSSMVGSEVAVDGIHLRKIITNPFFADPAQHILQPADGLNVGDTLRVYGPSTPAWYHYQILWNSVFEVLPQ